MLESNLKTIFLRQVIEHWWNDCCRKDWRTSFGDPITRNVLFHELAQRLFDEAKLGDTGEYPQDKDDELDVT